MTAKMRAISPVVAVLLLILVAVGAAVLIYLWLTGFAGQATQTPSSLQTQFTIETARIYNGTTDAAYGANATVELYLRNTGRTSIDLRVAQEQNALAIYIYDSYSGDLVYSNTTLLYKLLGKNIELPDTTSNFNTKNPTIDDVTLIYDGNRIGTVSGSPARY
ncbi:archaellin/type IV pilin N-terminal domain-containing protein [Pyrolobus fumarii]|nr:archaellin/type IV pilin N-terminal domain-containing protein [Pyrolobus fumarii]